MSIEEMKVLIQRFDDMFNLPNMDIADEIFAPDFVAHLPLMPILRRSNFKGFIMDINDRIITSQQLVLRLTFYGTHDGTFLGIAATGCQITMSGICIFTVENGLIVENWMEIDIFGVIRQISEKQPLAFCPSLASVN